MGSRDRPGKETKKKPKAKTGRADGLAPLSESAAERGGDPEAAQGEASVVEDDTDEGLIDGTDAIVARPRPIEPIDEERDERMAMTDERTAERAPRSAARPWMPPSRRSRSSSVAARS